ncbi:MAG: class I SAM-dependent methyltransferase [Clostridiales bacterium]|nr:class I SAM-dependent methyltransferase [Clostridiales bacterium]
MYYNRHMQYGQFAFVYDALMRDVDYNGWADYAAGFIPAGASVLECACGTGEMSLRLARKRYSVSACDISDDMLAVAAEKQREQGMFKADLRFFRADMRSLPAGKKYGCVLALCDGVNYLTSREDVKKFFSSAHSVLRDGGVLIFDISSRYKLEHVLGNNTFADDGEDLAYIWQNAYDPESKLVEMKLSFFVNRNGLYERFGETHIQRAHSVKEIMSWLRETGFEPEAYGFMTLEAPKETDERIQFAARKI